MTQHALVPFTCEICGAQLGEQAVPVCPRCHRVVCGRHLRRGSGDDKVALCDVCRAGSRSE